MDTGFTTKDGVGSRRVHSQIFTKKSSVSLSFMLTLPVPPLIEKKIFEKKGI